jgi:periplasmic protein TonB
MYSAELVTTQRISTTQRIITWLAAMSAGITCVLIVVSLMATLITPKEISANIQRLIAIDFINASKPTPKQSHSTAQEQRTEIQKPPTPSTLLDSNILLAPSLPSAEMLSNLMIDQPELILEFETSLPAEPRLTSPVSSPSPTFDEELYPIFKSEPVYPRRAKRSQTQGWVNIAFTINIQGEVENIEVLAAEPEGLFDASSINAVKSWKFKPQLLAGKATARRVVQTIKFELKK